MTENHRSYPKVKLGCSAPIFAPHCDLYNPKDGCIKKGYCSYQYDYEEGGENG